MKQHIRAEHGRVKPGHDDLCLSGKPDCSSLADAANAPLPAAAATAAAAASAAAASGTASAGAGAAPAASAAAATSAASLSESLSERRRPSGLLVEDVERAEADIGNLFFVQGNLTPRGRYPVWRRCVRHLADARRGCAARQRQRDAHEPQHRHYFFFSTAPLRSLLRTWHVGPPMPSKGVRRRRHWYLLHSRPARRLVHCHHAATHRESPQSQRSGAPSSAQHETRGRRSQFPVPYEQLFI